MKFNSYASRERVAAMLEPYVRQVRSTESMRDATDAGGAITAILAELDRRDAVSAAKGRLADALDVAIRAARAERIKLVDAPAGTECAENRSWSGYQYVSRPHKAKHLLNGTPYCGTHLKRVLERAQSDVSLDVRRAFVENAEDRAIVDADRDLIRQRREDANR